MLAVQPVLLLPLVEVHENERQPERGRVIQVSIDRTGVGLARLFDREQRATHGLAWLATYVEAVRQLAAYTERMVGAGTFGEIEENLVRIALGEYLAQIVGGIPMSQSEVVRPSDLGLSAAQVAARIDRSVEGLIASGNTVERRATS